MTNKNIDKLPEIYIVSYFNESEWNKNLSADDLKNQVLINESYRIENESQIRGYGPCRNRSCGCHCRKDKCDCRNPEFSIYKEGDWKIGNGTASGGIGLGGHSVSGDADFTLFRKTESNGEMKFGTVSAGVDAVDGGLGLHVKAGANLIDFKGDGVELKAGLNLDSGFGISSDGIELKAAGFGFAIGKKLEISTIAGGVSIDVDEACVIQ